jgi:hypothetical protein
MRGYPGHSRHSRRSSCSILAAAAARDSLDDGTGTKKYVYKDRSSLPSPSFFITMSPLDVLLPLSAQSVVASIISFLPTTLLICAVYFFLKTRPLTIPSTLPGPKRFPYVGYLPHVLQYWHEWPTETTRLAKLFKQTWGGPLPNFGGLPGAYFYIHDADNIQHILSSRFDNYVKGSMWDRVLGEMLGSGIFAVDGR